MGSGKRFCGRDLNISVLCCRDVEETSAAYIVGKRHGCAVERNRTRRILREAFRKLSPAFVSRAHVAVFPRRAPAHIRLHAATREMARLLTEAGLLTEDNGEGNDQET